MQLVDLRRSLADRQGIRYPKPIENDLPMHGKETPMTRLLFIALLCFAATVPAAAEDVSPSGTVPELTEAAQSLPTVGEDDDALLPPKESDRKIAAIQIAAKAAAEAAVEAQPVP